jgi:hypothetical protein
MAIDHALCRRLGYQPLIRDLGLECMVYLSNLLYAIRKYICAFAHSRLLIRVYAPGPDNYLCSTLNWVLLLTQTSLLFASDAMAPPSSNDLRQVHEIRVTHTLAVKRPV